MQFRLFSLPNLDVFASLQMLLQAFDDIEIQFKAIDMIIVLYVEGFIKTLVLSGISLCFF